MSRERVWEFVLLSSGLIFRVSDDVSAAWGLSFRCGAKRRSGMVPVLRFSACFFARWKRACHGGAELSVTTAWCPSYGFQRASSHAEKGLVMMVRSEASQRHGARPTVFSVQSYCFSASCTIPICNDFLVLLTTFNKFLSTTTQTTGTTVWF